MPVYHFTLHAYRSWTPDHPRGFVQRDKGVQPTNPNLARAYDAAAKFPKVTFTPTLQSFLIHAAHDICSRRTWRLHAVATDPTHLHLLISWRQFTKCQDVRRILKNILSLLLGRWTNQPSRPWFVRDGSRKRVTQQDHFNHLLTSYFPSHRGLQWYEGGSLPFPTPPC